MVSWLNLTQNGVQSFHFFYIAPLHYLVKLAWEKPYSNNAIWVFKFKTPSLLAMLHLLQIISKKNDVIVYFLAYHVSQRRLCNKFYQNPCEKHFYAFFTLQCAVLNGFFDRAVWTLLNVKIFDKINCSQLVVTNVISNNCGIANSEVILNLKTKITNCSAVFLKSLFFTFCKIV